jgi:hypothetical protein
MRYKTDTFELRDNGTIMRELSSAETNEVAGGTGLASVSAFLEAIGTGSSAHTTSSGFSLSATNTSAAGNIFQTVSAVGTVSLGTSSFAEVF